MKKTSPAMPSGNTAKPATPRRKPAPSGKAPRQEAQQQLNNKPVAVLEGQPAIQAKVDKPAKAPVKAPAAMPAGKPQVNSDSKPPVNGDSKPAQAKAQASTTKPVTGESKLTEARSEKKAKKAKVVRDSFTMPEADYGKIAALKKQCLAAGLPVKKSELLRAGLNALAELPMTELAALISRLENVKTGRPSKL